jgi:hypothetical protein
MKYSLRSLMIAVLVLPPLLALGWEGWHRLYPRRHSIPWLICSPDDDLDFSSDDLLSCSSPGGRINP